MRLSSLVLTVGAVVAAAGIAAAQPASAPTQDAIHKQGRAKAKVWRDTGNVTALADAVQLFKDALAMGDSPAIECDLGVALHHLGEEARAYARLTRCMPRLAAASPAKVAGYRSVVNAVDAAVRKDHVAVDISTSPPGAVISISTFPADETMVAPTLLWLRPGTHKLTAHVDGHVDMTFTLDLTEDDARKGVRKSWKVKLERAIEPGGGTEPDGPKPDGPKPDGPKPDGPKPPDPGAGGGGDLGAVGGLVGFGDAVGSDTPPPRRSRKAAYGTLAVGGALLVGGAVVHVLGRDERAHLDSLDALGERDDYDAYLPTWQRYQRATIGLYAAGAIATGVGAWLYVRGRTPAPLAISPAPEGTGAMLWVIAR